MSEMIQGPNAVFPCAAAVISNQTEDGASSLANSGRRSRTNGRDLIKEVWSTNYAWAVFHRTDRPTGEVTAYDEGRLCIFILPGDGPPEMLSEALGLILLLRMRACVH